jgi:pilus assembly protein CpaB
MNRRNRTLTVLTVAVVLASLASLGVYRAVVNLPVREVQVGRTFTVVASRFVPVGSQLTGDDLKVVPWPAESQVRGGYSRPQEIIGRGLVRSVAEDEPLTESNMAPRAAGAGLPPTIPLGMRAMSVRVNDVIGVAGFVVPGTHVDVIVTAHVSQGGSQDSMSRAVLSDIQVLAAGTRLDQDKKDGQPIPTSVVTLLLTPADSERLALAASDGGVMLALRNPLDPDETKTSGARMASLMAAPVPPPAPASRVVQGRPRMVTPATPPPGPYTIEAIRASKQSEEIIK